MTTTAKMLVPAEAFGWMGCARGVLAGHEVAFTPAHRCYNPTPVALTVTLSLPLSVEDVVAALWLNVRSGMTLAELADDRLAREIILDTLANGGTGEVGDAATELRTMHPDHPHHPVVAAVRERVRELCADTVTDAPGPLPAGRIGVTR